MAGPRSWTVLFLCISFGVFSVKGNDKGLVVSTFYNWVYDGQLQVYHNDPSTYQTNTTTSITKKSVGYYAQVTSIVANTRTNSLLMLDANENTIYNYENFNLYMNDTRGQFSVVHTGVSATTSQIAVDWYTGNVYWTDGYYKYIATHPLIFPNDTSVYKILISDHLTKPEGIAVDPAKRYLFWSDVIKDKSKIERSSTTGSDRTVIVQSNLPIWISSLALDTDNEKIYWSDIGRQTLEYCDYDGSKRAVLRRIIGGTFLSITMSKDVLCGTEYNYLNVMCFDKTTGNTTWFSSYTFQEPWAITVFDNEQQKITTNNPCDGNQCEHMCFNTGANIATCGCKEGYKLKGDSKSCESENGLLFGKSIIVTNSTAACMYDIHVATNNKQAGDCFLTRLSNLTFFSVDSHERMFYYVDFLSSSINKVDMITTIEQTVYVDTAGVAAITGLSYDWNTKNVYWTDSAGGKILVHSTSTGATTDLLTQLDEPKYITVSPHLRKMFWLTGSGFSSTLEEGNLDGSSLKTLLGHGEISYPEALFYDDKTDKLYWNNYGDIVSMKPDLSNPVYHAYAGYSTNRLLVYKEYSYWIIGNDDLEMAHLDATYEEVTVSTGMGTLTAVGVYAVDVQPKEKNNCTNFNGGCQHICQPTGATTMQCFCDFGYTLQNDGKGCSNEPFKDSFAILPDVTHNKLYQIALTDGEIRALDIPDIDVPVSAIFDNVTNKIYWTNALKSEIRASPLKSLTSEVIYSTYSVLPIGLAFDYSSGLLYFTTEYYWEPSFIGCIHPHAGIMKTLINNLDLPKNIALYPSKGIMFWTDISTSSTSTSYIGSSFMDGTNMKKIVANNINSPNGIVIDYTENRIYWADGDLSIIDSVDLAGQNRVSVIAEAGHGLVGLDISPPYLYYVGRNKQKISKYDLSTKHKLEFMNDIHALGRIETVRVYPEQTQPINTHCATKNGNCALFCLPIPTGRICGCEDGDTLKSDGKSCNQLTSCDTNIPNAILSDRCLGHATGKCNFTCSSGFEKAFDILECQNDGNWNHNINTVCQSLTGTCSGFIPHGHVTPQCDKKINSMCTYTCSAGYVPDPNNLQIQCLASGAWSKPVDQLCTFANVYCPTTIDNGQLSSVCNRAAGTVCDYSCTSGFSKNPSVKQLLCSNDGKWDINSAVCIPESTVRCKKTLQNGAIDSQCLFRVKDQCEYSCNTGYTKNSLLQNIVCMDDGNWNVNVDKLCNLALLPCTNTIDHGSFTLPCSGASGTKCNYRCDTGYVKQPIAQHVICHNGQWTTDPSFLCLALLPCNKTIDHGSFMSSCSGASGSKCDYTCDTGYVQQPIAQNVVCHNGQWTTDPSFLCVEPTGTVISSQTSQSEGIASGTVAGIVIVAILITIAIVLGIVFIFWRKKKPQGTYVSNNTKLKFNRFDDTNVPTDPGVTGFSNPIATQPEYGNFSHLREEGYITTEVATPYDEADPKNITVSLEKPPTTNGVSSKSEA